MFKSSEIKIKYDKIRYLPTLVGTLNPLSILLSFPCLTGKWKSIERSDSYKMDKGITITALISCAIIFQLIANTALLARFWEKRIVLSTFISIFFFTAHASFMLGPIIHFWVWQYPAPQEKFTGDFMAGVGASFISLISILFLLIDYFRQDQLRRKGSGITNNQRTLVVFSIIVTMWSAIGAIIFSTVEGWSFTRGIYFTMVTMTTIGFGDLVPKHIGTRIFLFFYAIVGMVIMGILINSIRIVILDGFENIYMQKMEEFQRTYYGEIKSSEDISLLNSREQLLSGQFDPEDASNTRMKKRNHLNNEKWTLLTRQLQFSIISLILFWFLGAVIFKYIEDWSYFDAVYFCFVSFTTIGYGDITLSTFPGIVAFIGYSLLGLVAAAYVISVGTEMSSRAFDKRIERINYKQKQKIEGDSGNNDKEELDKLLLKFETLSNENDEMGLICELISICKIYQRYVGVHLIDSNGLFSSEHLNHPDFQSLEQYHLLFCKLLRHLENKVDPEIQSKFDTMVSKELVDSTFRSFPSSFKDNEDSDPDTIEMHPSNV